MTEKIPILESLDEAYKKLLHQGLKIPDISGCETICCFSDYAGDRPSDKNHVFSFLYFDYKHSGLFKSEVEKLRASESHWNDNSFIEYKKVPGDNVRTRMLPSFLDIANKLKGCLVIVYVDKSIDSIFDYSGNNTVSKVLKEEGFGHWAPQIAEKLLQVLMFKSYFLSQFITEKQKYFWYSDRDALNDEGGPRISYVGQLFGRFMDLLNIKIDFSGYGTNFEKSSPDNYFGDILSIPDLVAGATLEYFEEQFGEDNVKLTTDKILQWFAKPSPTLQKIHFRLRKEDKKFIFSTIEWNLK